MDKFLLERRAFCGGRGVLEWVREKSLMCSVYLREYSMVMASGYLTSVCR